MARPLDGIRVLDLTNVLAGPYCTYHLGLLGAEVVKVEQPQRGDLARALGADAELNRQGLGASFLAQNAGKKSVELNLKDPADKQVFLDLAARADVVVENFRPGVMARLGLGADRLRELNPSLVYCAVSGFGQEGPLSQRPAYDQIIQGLSGIMSITGTPEAAPLRVGFPIADSVGGLMAALAVCGSLVARDEDGRRVGATLDVSLLEASLSTMGWAVGNFFGAGVEPGPIGNQNFTAAPSGTFEAADGPLNIAANRQEQFLSLCEAIDRPELALDPRFNQREARKTHREALNAEVNAGLASKTALEWEEILNDVGVPAARILTVPAALSLSQLVERGFLHQLEFPGDSSRELMVMSNGVLFDGESLAPQSRPPLLGEHNETILKEIGAKRVNAAPPVNAISSREGSR
jgi:crotonobetainyl-CoA:carnitine CoA-transferase CaiB-like acyl-CoA transferase